MFIFEYKQAKDTFLVLAYKQATDTYEILMGD